MWSEPKSDEPSIAKHRLEVSPTKACKAIHIIPGIEGIDDQVEDW